MENEEEHKKAVNMASSKEEAKKEAERKAAEAMKAMMEGFRKEQVWLRFKVNKCE